MNGTASTLSDFERIVNIRENQNADLSILPNRLQKVSYAISPAPSVEEKDNGEAPCMSGFVPDMDRLNSGMNKLISDLNAEICRLEKTVSTKLYENVKAESMEKLR